MRVSFPLSPMCHRGEGMPTRPSHRLLGLLVLPFLFLDQPERRRRARAYRTPFSLREHELPPFRGVAEGVAPALDDMDKRLAGIELHIERAKRLASGSAWHGILLS